MTSYSAVTGMEAARLTAESYRQDLASLRRLLNSHPEQVSVVLVGYNAGQGGVVPVAWGSSEEALCEAHGFAVFRLAAGHIVQLEGNALEQATAAGLESLVKWPAPGSLGPAAQTPRAALDVLAEVGQAELKEDTRELAGWFAMSRVAGHCNLGLSGDPETIIKLVFFSLHLLLASGHVDRRRKLVIDAYCRFAWGSS